MTHRNWYKIADISVSHDSSSIFYIQDGRSRFVWNVGKFLKDDRLQCSRREVLIIPAVVVRIARSLGVFKSM